MEPNIIEAAALYRLGHITSEDLPRLAEQAMLSGFDSESLTLLAIETDKIMSTVGPIFERCLEELHIDAIENGECCYIAATYFAKQYLCGELNAVEFGFKVGNLTTENELPKELFLIFQEAMWHEEAPFEYGYPSDWQGFQKKCESNIMHLAKNLVQKISQEIDVPSSKHPLP